MNLFEITNQKIDPALIIEKVVSNNAGAITTFIGTVREFTNERQTKFLTYECYETMAIKQMEKIATEIYKKWDNIKIAITHRIGKLEISEIAIVIAVSSPHRNDAYEANRYAIERIKEIVPIWKKEHWTNGEKWVGNQLGTIAYKDGAPKTTL